MTQDTAARTQDEIVARIGELKGNDFFGFATEVLVDALDFEHAKPWLKEDTTAEQWDEARPKDFVKRAAEYYEFAVGKIRDHRGISANRGVDKLTQYAWLLGKDDVVAAMNAAGYTQYGAPKVRAFAEGMGLAWPGGSDLERMSQGLKCEEFCDSGCGQ